jgi:hypothetical protein
MCCPRHSKEGGGACPGLIYPLDEHEQGPEDERREGYTHCDTCGASTAGDHTWRDLDTRVARLHADLVLALRMQPPSTGDEGDWKLLQRLRDLYTRARAVLCADHWLMYRLHERIASTAQEQALALRQGDPSEFRQRVAWFAEHANGQLQCAMALVPLRIHLSAHLHEQAAESLAALLAVLDDRATDLTSAQGSHTAPHSTSNDPRKRARIETSEAQVASLQSLAADAVRKRMRQYQQEAARAHIALARWASLHDTLHVTWPTTAELYGVLEIAFRESPALISYLACLDFLSHIWSVTDFTYKVGVNLACNGSKKKKKTKKKVKMKNMRNMRIKDKVKVRVRVRVRMMRPSELVHF